MKSIKRTVMVSPVGLEKDRVLAGFKKFGATNLYLIQSIKKEDSEKRLADMVRVFAAELKDYLDKIMDNIFIEDVNITDLKDCLKILKKIVNDEIKNGAFKIYINISTSSKIFAIASIYIAGLYPNLIVPFYVKTSNYLVQEFIDILNNEKKLQNPAECINDLKKIKENFETSGWTKGEFNIHLIPALVFKKFTEFQKSIINEILKNQNKLTLGDLIKKLNIKDIKERSFRSKLSYALHDLISYGLIKKIKEGIAVNLILTEIGEIFSNFLI